MFEDSTTGCHKKLYYYNSMFIVFVECREASLQDVLQDTQSQEQQQQMLTQHENRSVAPTIITTATTKTTSYTSMCAAHTHRYNAT